MENSMDTAFEYDPFDELQRLAEIAQFIFDLNQQMHESIAEERHDALSRAQRTVAWWDGRLETQRSTCANASACLDRRCRRKQVCRRLSGVAAKAARAQQCLAAEQAKWPASEPKTGCDKKGRTEVRP